MKNGKKLVSDYPYFMLLTSRDDVDVYSTSGGNYHCARMGGVKVGEYEVFGPENERGWVATILMDDAAAQAQGD